MAPDLKALAEQSDSLYETHCKPLEAEHWGEFAAVASDGRLVLADTLDKAQALGRERFGKGNFLFQIGPIAIGRWR